MKSSRQEEILRIISEQEIETQEELANCLRERGYQVTQATVSRDIRELHLMKSPGRKSSYFHTLPGKQQTGMNERMIRLLADSTVDVDYAGQLVVVKTLSGSANVACESIDNMKWKEVMGSIAGDNTIFFAVRNEEDAAEIAGRIRKLAGKE